MEEKGRKEARRILEGLGYHVEEIGGVKTPYPYDLIAEKGEEHLLIDVKYAERSRGSAGFPAPWIRRAYQELKKRSVSESWKAQVLLIAKHGDYIMCLSLEPRFKEPWFKLDV